MDSHERDKVINNESNSSLHLRLRGDADSFFYKSINLTWLPRVIPHSILYTTYRLFFSRPVFSCINHHIQSTSQVDIKVRAIEFTMVKSMSTGKLFPSQMERIQNHM